jgi:hypothetical protein
MAIAQGSLIPDAADISHYELQSDIGWVLVVEKEVIFLVHIGFSTL